MNTGNPQREGPCGPALRTVKYESAQQGAMPG